MKIILRGRKDKLHFSVSSALNPFNTARSSTCIKLSFLSIWPNIISTLSKPCLQHSCLNSHKNDSQSCWTVAFKLIILRRVLSYAASYKKVTCSGSICCPFTAPWLILWPRVKRKNLLRWVMKIMARIMQKTMNMRTSFNILSSSQIFISDIDKI